MFQAFSMHQKIKRDKGSSTYKKQRKRYTFIANTTQTRIANYFRVVDRVYQLIRGNYEHKTCTDSCILENQTLEQNKNCKVAYSSLLDILSETVITNSIRLGTGKNMTLLFIYLPTIPLYVRWKIVCETLFKNLPLPSPTSIGRYLKEYGPRVIEGQFRFNEPPTNAFKIVSSLA